MADGEGIRMCSMPRTGEKTLETNEWPENIDRNNRNTSIGRT